MSIITSLAINAVKRSLVSFCKFISANDAGKTGGHQSGFYIPLSCWPLMFDKPGIKGENSEHIVKIRWQNDFQTESRFIYYGKETRNENRLTRFGRGFPFLQENNVGDLLILCKIDDDDYEGYVLSTDQEIEDFFAAFNLSPEQTNRLINNKSVTSPSEELQRSFAQFTESQKGFPSTEIMSEYARIQHIQAYSISTGIINKEPDKYLIEWIKAEYELFKAAEIKLYSNMINRQFSSVDEFTSISNTILNRRKSRAGKSLEHHLSYIFTVAQLRFETQVVTEGKKRPDFIFPGSAEYHTFEFPGNKLVCLAAKTTCKDRWRQVINEADRIPVKHLFTLQQGISKNQLNEMYQHNVCLVVPKPYLKSFDKSFRDRIMTLETFNMMVREKQK